MEDKEILSKIKEWAEDSHAYLSSSTPYSRGYKDAISIAKEIILGIINSNED